LSWRDYEARRPAAHISKVSSLEELPHGAKVGTSSLRRQCQLKSVRPDLEIFPLRGNVDTRLRKLESGEYEAIILAAAGVLRLGLETHVRSRISADVMCPAVGQGALAIEIRRGDQQTKTLLAFLNDADTHAAIDCERALLGSLGGGCQVPVRSVSLKRGNACFSVPWWAGPLMRYCASKRMEQMA
jgi:hydroxymethylbilane synthase